MNKHFLTVMRRGRRPASSGGERAAYLLARAIVDYAGSLDDAALDGAAKLLVFAWSNPNAARDLVDGHVDGDRQQMAKACRCPCHAFGVVNDEVCAACGCGVER